MNKNRPFKYKLMKDGVCVACVESADKERAEREIQHYAMIYSQDGEVKIVPEIRKQEAEGK